MLPGATSTVGPSTAHPHQIRCDLKQTEPTPHWASRPARSRSLNGRRPRLRPAAPREPGQIPASLILCRKIHAVLDPLNFDLIAAVTGQPVQWVVPAGEIT